MNLKLFSIVFSIVITCAFSARASSRWDVGSNYITSNAVNQLEMWEASTFDPKTIDRELGWAENLHMNMMRVFLHDLLWKEDAAGFKKRISAFLAIAKKHHIQVIFVLFDSCWNPEPHIGPQPAPVPGRHNSQWVQSPGLKVLSDPAEYPRLKDYIQGVIGKFANDPRIYAWDLWNEPDNLNPQSYRDPTNKLVFVQTLLPQVFRWAKQMNPSQPLTSGLWAGDWQLNGKLTPIQKSQIELSDIISFHSYERAKKFELQIQTLQTYKRPIVCTEFLARPLGSTFEEIYPVAKKYGVAILNWGLVAGKTQTELPWISWRYPQTKIPRVWFHDIFHVDGRPWSELETRFIAQMRPKTITGDDE